jgi:glycosyltransferase involved in cell wall biosynthesis
MKIAYIAAGAAGMYCGSCLHDNALAAAILRKGHEIALIPTYTPIRTDEKNVSLDRIFFGGINIYLQQKFPFFRRTSAPLDGLFDHPGLLNWISRMFASTDARELGALTISMLEGENGNLKKELEKLVEWLQGSYQPDIIQLTNSMFAGMAGRMKEALGVPIICAMQGEDIFLEQLFEPYKSQVVSLLRDKAKDIDGFIATSDYYAEFMAEYLDVPPEKIHKVKLGINLEGHGGFQIKDESGGPSIGYLARICPEKGLHILLEAFYQLNQERDLPKIKLKVAGYLSKRDHAYYEEIKEKISSWGLDGDFEYWGEVDRNQKIHFLNSVDVLSVPTAYKDPKGLFVLEAMANGVPVVQPRHGAFPELIKATGGGILVKPDSPTALAKGIHSLLDNPKKREKLGNKGMEVVHRDFSAAAMAEATLEVYGRYLD